MKNIFFNKKDLKFLGKNTIIGKTVRIRKPEKVSIGENTIIDDFTYISCAMKIGKNCHIGPGVVINGGDQIIEIGDNVDIGANSTISTSSSNFLVASISSAAVNKKYHFGTISEKIIINDHVLVGSNTVILPGVNLPKGLASSCMTVLRKKKYKEWSLYGGFEGSFISQRNKKLLMNKLKNTKNKN